VSAKIGNGAMFGFDHSRDPLQYYLRETRVSECRVLSSIPIASLVTALNLMKAVSVLHTALCIRKEPPMTMRDAVSSFLEQPNLSTLNLCLASSKKIQSAGYSFIFGPRRWKVQIGRNTTSMTR
jgi:hypothetical protein